MDPILSLCVRLIFWQRFHKVRDLTSQEHKERAPDVIVDRITVGQ